MISDGSGAQPVKQLRRSRDHKVIAGVCGGIAEYFVIDPLMVRIAFVVLACMGGGGVVAYIISWIAIPEATTASPPRSSVPRETPNVLGVVFGAIFVGLGVALLFGSLVEVLRGGLGLALVALGIAFIVVAATRK